MQLKEMLQVLKTQGYDKHNKDGHNQDIELQFKDELGNYYEFSGLDIDLYLGCHCKGGIIIRIRKENE